MAQADHDQGGHAAHGGVGHAHHHHGDLVALRASQRRVLTGVLLANAAFFGVELVGALAFDSLSLLADAGHLLSDVAGIAVALIAARLVAQPASRRHTYGLQRAEVLAAQANGITLVAVCGWVVVTALRRLSDPVEVAGVGQQ